MKIEQSRDMGNHGHATQNEDKTQKTKKILAT